MAKRKQLRRVGDRASVECIPRGYNKMSWAHVDGLDTHFMCGWGTRSRIARIFNGYTPHYRKPFTIHVERAPVGVEDAFAVERTRQSEFTAGFRTDVVVSDKQFGPVRVLVPQHLVRGLGLVPGSYYFWIEGFMTKLPRCEY